ncbi:PhzF family phenazine biosynthesis protein [Pararhizobium haloflavum]|uniref:PhzF family phenazine biosynthesis protein n=1 Tax=Pararhizobium haloflavum TaxID=2037914 RepID=UPI000C190792|nr:PhzF family phenazine biosynthesis protein [Pararhizobium haloflavum]
MTAKARARAYGIYDVFTGTALAGNPLAVVFDAEGLDGEAMQALAREFNLSETVFVGPPQKPGHAAAFRIFTPMSELPFAGHPTVGGAVALAHFRNGHEAGARDIDTVLMIEEKVGNVRCAVRFGRAGAGDERRRGFAEFDLPRLSAPVACTVKRDQVAEALGVSPRQIGFENHVISVFSAGVPYVLVPMHDRAAVEKCRCDGALWEALAPLHEGHLASAFVYCRGGLDHTADFHARMFAPSSGILEDPATGSAVAALSGAILKFDALLDGHHSMVVEQGVEMGRPSKIQLYLEVAGGAAVRARIGGEAVQVAEGTLTI